MEQEQLSGLFEMMAMLITGSNNHEPSVCKAQTATHDSFSAVKSGWSKVGARHAPSDAAVITHPSVLCLGMQVRRYSMHTSPPPPIRESVRINFGVSTHLRHDVIFWTVKHRIRVHLRLGFYNGFPKGRGVLRPHKQTALVSQWQCKVKVLAKSAFWPQCYLFGFGTK